MFIYIFLTLYLYNISLFPIHHIGRLITMARFPEAEERLLNKKVCMKCGCINAPRAERCRRCRSKELRVKAKEGRGV